MALTVEQITWRHIGLWAVAASLALLSACSIYDEKALLAPKNAVLLIDQKHQDASLRIAAAAKPQTDLKGIHVNTQQFPVTASNSLAVALPETANSSPANNLEQAQKQLMRYLLIVEKQPEQIEKLISDAEQLAKQYPDDALMQSLLQRLSRYSDWQPINAIINNAGIDFVSVTGWQPESPFIRTRRALLPPVADNEHVIFADQRLVFLLNNPAAVSLHIDARLEDVPFLPESPTTLLYQVDELPKQAIQLRDNADWHRLTLAIPAGDHALRFYQQTPIGNQYVKLRFDDHISNLAVTQERPYFISTTDSPLQFYSQGPSVLRIDELDNGNMTYRYQQVPEGWQTISLPPIGKPRSLLRVSQRVVNLQPQPPSNRLINRPLNPIPKPEMTVDLPIQPEKVLITDKYKLGKQEDGTFSPGFDLVRRNNKQESGALLNEEQFAQYRLNYRYFDEPRDTYWNSQGLLRIREYGGPTLGLNESVYYNPEWLPFNVRSSAKLFAQAPQNDWETLALWDIAIAQAYKLHPKTMLIPNLAFFARALSLRNNPLNSKAPDFDLRAREIDQDVYTPYKAQRTMGLTPGLTLEHRPWLDTIWSAKAAIQSYEDLDFTDPDHYRTELHWQQLLGSVSLDASYRSAFYQANDFDRFNSSTRSFAELEVNWQHWTSHQNRFEISAGYSYDVQRTAHLATLGFTLHFGEGRGLRDFAPNEIDFRDIRQRQFRNGDNNLIREVNSAP